MSPAFQYKTNWVVITGAPSSGKTSVIEALRQRGCAVQNEVARQLIELGIGRGRSLEEIRRHAEDLQKDILEVALAREMALDPKTETFLDRGIPDSLTYFQLAGLDGMEARAVSLLFQYRAVFIFNRLPIAKDGIRTEDEAVADKIDRMLEEDYKSVGYTPVRVPVIPVKDRADFILKHLSGL